jgi:hypothetical protein
VGLDAHVLCRCLDDGLATLPPFPVKVDEEDRLVPDADVDFHAYLAWLGSAFEHPSLQLVSVGVSNWSGVRLFQEALRALGADEFPTLLAEIPDLSAVSTGHCVYWT